MSAAIAFQLPAAWVGLVPICALILWAAARQRVRGCSPRRVLLLASLRFLPLAGLVFLAARPVRLTAQASKASARPVMVLLDRSESMSLKEGGLTRYQKAVEFLDRRLLPALKSANLPVQGLLFDQNAQPARSAEIQSARPEGKRTNLGGAIAQALSAAGQAPLAVIALTDGIANESVDNARAMSALVGSAVPFIGVGFGGDQGVQTLALRKVDAPTSVSPHSAFALTAELQWMNAEDATEFDLVLFRDGQAIQRKSVLPVRGSRTWLESFHLNGESEGVHQYTVQLLPPKKPDCYTLKVLDPAKQVVAERPIEIRATDVELEQTARNMETLRQWAGITDGLAFKIEECPKAADLVAQINAKVEQVRQTRQTVRTAGLNGWTLSLILGCLSLEWVLRKRWELT